MHTALYCS